MTVNVSDMRVGACLQAGEEFGCKVLVFVDFVVVLKYRFLRFYGVWLL